MDSRRIDYLWRQILTHARLFFSPDAYDGLAAGTVVFLPYEQAVRTRSRIVIVPTDIGASIVPQTPYRVPFNGTHLTLWNPLPRPPGEEWRAIPDAETPLWYQHNEGAVMPAWNLAVNCLDLLTFREERESTQRDTHGRFAARFSPRVSGNLLEVPAFNEAVAALVAACVGLRRNGVPCLHLEGLLPAPTIVLSHDCDLLRGDDIWTQMVRVYRVIEPLRRGRIPRPRHLWWAARNVVSPQRFYFKNVAGMIDLEWQFGFTSAFYLLNGRGGRFGARSGSRLLTALTRVISEEWAVGMHYNYDTHLDRGRFEQQRTELCAITGTAPVAGRAHYLRFDPERSFSFLDSYGFRCDESAGYADAIGYRCGIGGCFQAYDTSAKGTLSIWEVPLTIMDETLGNQYGGASVAAFSRLLTHLGRVGGALTLLFHPGVFHNPEFPRMLGLYRRLLIECRQSGARSLTAPKLVEMACEYQRGNRTADVRHRLET